MVLKVVLELLRRLKIEGWSKASLDLEKAQMMVNA